MPKIEQEIEKLVTKPIEDIGYELYDVIYRKEGKDNYLTIFIDNKQGISLEDCEKVNNEITDMLDERDLIKEPYFLEVSSPGIERVLRKEKHFKDNIGNEIYVKSFIKIKEVNKKEIEGILENYDNETITINANEKIIKLRKDDIAIVKKVYKI